MHEQRLVQRLTNYWEMLRSDQTIPDYAKFNVSAVQDIWAHCILFLVRPDNPPTVNFYNVGDQARLLYGPDIVGRTMNPRQRHYPGAMVVRRVGELVANPAPIYDEGQFINERSKVVKYRSCLLPFGDRQGKVTHVVAGLSWREF